MPCARAPRAVPCPEYSTIIAYWYSCWFLCYTVVHYCGFLHVTDELNTWNDPKERLLEPITLASDAAIDLHMHTTYSDGHWQPEELFRYLAEHHFSLVAVTDHDRIDRIEEMQALGRQVGIPVLPGVEVTTQWEGQMGHVLCYGIDPANAVFSGLLQKTVSRQLENTCAVYEELRQRGYEFPRQAEVLAEQGGDLVRPVDNARLMQAHGYTHSISEAMKIVTAA